MRLQAYVYLGWTPILAVATDGARRVLQVTGWEGGSGTAPATGLYVGATGYVSLIGDAVDIRGASGGGGGAWGSITGTLSAQTDLQSALDAKVDENTSITGATKTKITYDAKGLVTSGTDATTADISDSTNKRYVTDANLSVINNTSGVNTGDQSAGGSNKQIQYNDGGDFAGAIKVEWDNATEILTVSARQNITIAGSPATLNNPTLQATNSVNDYTQISIQNKSAGVNSSADLIAYADNVSSSDLTGFADIGMSGSGFAQAAYAVTGANDGYFFVSAPTASGNAGNMVLATDATGTSNDIIFFTDGFDDLDNERMRITDTAVTIEPNTTVTGTIAASNLSGTNTGDNATNTQYSGLAASKQDTLVSATNIKTVNGSTLLGSGDLSIGGSDPTKLAILNNLSDLNNAGTARTNLGLGTLATQSGTFSGTSSGTNTGDNATNTQYSGLVSNATHTGDATGATALTVVRINGTSLAGLATGLLKNTTGTGVPSIAVNSDLPTMTATVGGAVPTPPNNTTTFLRGDGTFATPVGSGDMVLANVQTVTGAKTFNDTKLLLRNVANTFNGSFVNNNTADRIYTLKDAAGTIAFTSDITGTNSGTNTGDQTTITGNAGTATSLQTARNIGGVSFNGTADIVPQTIESANEAADTTCFPLFITASGTQQLQPKNNTGLTYNASTNNLAATTFTGALSGNATTVTTNANLTGNVTSVGNATTIATNVVTNAMLAQVATQIFRGRTTAGTGNIEDLSVTQATALLNTFTSVLKGLVPASGGGTTTFLRADGTFAVPAGGGGSGTSLGLVAAINAIGGFI
jgi:hypothetical protein